MRLRYDYNAYCGCDYDTRSIPFKSLAKLKTPVLFKFSEAELPANNKVFLHKAKKILPKLYFLI